MTGYRAQDSEYTTYSSKYINSASYNSYVRDTYVFKGEKAVFQ